MICYAVLKVGQTVIFINSQQKICPPMKILKVDSIESRHGGEPRLVYHVLLNGQARASNLA
jgi:hypothetical protein